MGRTLLVLCFIVVSISAFSAPRPKVETISGRVVAYSNSLACMNGNGYWSMIIRLQPPKDIPSKLIRVEFSLPCNKSPEWVLSKPSIQRYRLYRKGDCDVVLEGSMAKDEEQIDIPLPIWKYPPGTEPFTLPFGQVLPCYRSEDMLLLPVV